MIEFENAIFKDFRNISELNIDERSKISKKYLRYKKYDDNQSYRVISKYGYSSKMIIESKYSQEFISLVSYDYLVFSQHLLVKEAAINNLMKYRTGAGVSPVIGTLRAATDLFKRGVYTNPIFYPAVSKKDSRIRTSLSASHSIDDLDIVLYKLPKTIC